MPEILKTKGALAGRTKRARVGFTLVEMLVVLTIIGIIAFFAVASYSAARKQAKLDLAADSLVSAFNEQTQNVKGGRDDARTSAQNQSMTSQAGSIRNFCFGLHLQKQAPFVQNFASPYVSASGQEADLCDILHQNLTRFDLFEDLKIGDLTIDGTAVESLDVIFKPPFAKVLARSGDGPMRKFLKIIFSIAFQNAADKRVIEIDGSKSTAARSQNLNL